MHITSNRAQSGEVQHAEVERVFDDKIQTGNILTIQSWMRTAGLKRSTEYKAGDRSGIESCKT